jgi:hypothetical protein
LLATVNYLNWKNWNFYLVFLEWHMVTNFGIFTSKIRNLHSKSSKIFSRFCLPQILITKNHLNSLCPNVSAHSQFYSKIWTQNLSKFKHINLNSKSFKIQEHTALFYWPKYKIQVHKLNLKLSACKKFVLEITLKKTSD